MFAVAVAVAVVVAAVVAAVVAVVVCGLLTPIPSSLLLQGGVTLDSKILIRHENYQSRYVNFSLHDTGSFGSVYKAERAASPALERARQMGQQIDSHVAIKVINIGALGTYT